MIAYFKNLILRTAEIKLSKEKVEPTSPVFGVCPSIRHSWDGHDTLCIITQFQMASTHTE